MSGQVEADGVEFMRQPVKLVPVGDLRQVGNLQGNAGPSPEQARLAAFTLGHGSLGITDQGFDTAMDLAPIAVETVEGAGAGQVFKLPLVDNLGIEPAGEIEQVFVPPALFPL